MKENFCYIHIPFCTSKCKYCRFASFWNMNSLKINLYVQKLIKEIEKTNFNLENNILKTIYFWWGTPSTLSIKQFENIFKIMKFKYIFDENIEISIEATPITITKENLTWWKKIWITRISIWVQTLNTDSLKEIGRWEKGDILKALSILKDFKRDFNISIDLIIGLPYVKKLEIKKDLEFILHNYDYVNHVSIYMLEEYYEQWTNDSKFQNVIYPNNWNHLWINEDDYLSEYIEIKEFLQNKWFLPYEISNYAKPWYECKHNQSYWNHSNILAFWLWSHWLVNNVRFSNSEEFSSYYSEKNKEYDILLEQDLFTEKIMFWLRTKWLVKEDYEKLNIEKLNYFITEWLLEKDTNSEEKKIILTNRWTLLMDYILGEII
jgi:oxygen-independent coproporphyrinogen-3 oxidase